MNELNELLGDPNIYASAIGGFLGAALFAIACWFLNLGLEGIRYVYHLLDKYWGNTIRFVISQIRYVDYWFRVITKRINDKDDVKYEIVIGNMPVNECAFVEPLVYIKLRGDREREITSVERDAWSNYFMMNGRLTIADRIHDLKLKRLEVDPGIAKAIEEFKAYTFNPLENSMSFNPMDYHKYR